MGPVLTMCICFQVQFHEMLLFFHCKYCANEIILPSVHTATSALTAVGKGLETHLEFLLSEKFIGNNFLGKRNKL